jgi:uncharacterized protein (DUF433 family)
MRTPEADPDLDLKNIDLEPEIIFIDGPGDTTVRPANRDAPPAGTNLQLRRPPRAEMLTDLPRITFDPDKWTGLACIQEARVTVAAILRSLAAGRSVQETLAAYPGLGVDDIRQALEYAARQVEIPVIPPESVAAAEKLKRLSKMLSGTS